MNGAYLLSGMFMIMLAIAIHFTIIGKMFFAPALTIVLLAFGILMIFLGSLLSFSHRY